MKFMPNCKEATRLIASGEIERLGLPARLMVRLHFRICRCCPTYVEALKKTVAYFREKYGRPVPPEDVRRLSEAITRRLLAGPPPRQG